MIIQAILIAGLSACLFYAFVQRRRSPQIGLALALVAAAGVYFVLFPQQTSRIANFMGVGRGADLLLYCWLVISLMLLISLQFKIANLQRMITALAREITLQAALGGAPTDDQRAASGEKR